MTKPPERTPAGIPVLRHEARERPEFVPAASTPETVEELEAHVSRWFGEPSTVWHEIISDTVHLDVHVIRPTPERSWFTLFTTGMSDLPMTAPAQLGDDARFAELMICLPPDWPFPEEAFAVGGGGDSRAWYWPVAALKRLARLPHDYATWLGFGHTIPNGDPAEPFVDGTRLCCWWLLPPLTVPDEGRVAKLSDGRAVNLFTLHALYPEEISLKLNKGGDALLEAFSNAEVSEVLDLRRRPAVRKKLFGLF